GNRRDIRGVFEPDGDIRAVVGDERDQRAADPIVDEAAHARDFREYDHDQRGHHRNRAYETGRKERDNKECDPLERIGINPCPIGSNDADGKRNAGSHHGYNEREYDDKNSADEGHGLSCSAGHPPTHNHYQNRRPLCAQTKRPRVTPGLSTFFYPSGGRHSRWCPVLHPQLDRRDYSDHETGEEKDHRRVPLRGNADDPGRDQYPYAE